MLSAFIIKMLKIVNKLFGSTSKRHLKGFSKIVDQINQHENALKNLSDENDSLYFLDVRPPMLLENGKADPSLFIKDMLHMNKKGYEVWTKIVKTALIENL